ncbi:MAG: hypothetical protein C7B45_01020 [Sulfobacillus acidophilus]|uniref:Tyr recombinase domain-containing protein n=1 Tax=Sulfobacillus acidophilus TaxID=53633 RepID=A0A2T2WNU1_9FIRM|nr:MAG: hypothetical protein C7B45_01020 [Sulfobacillus acidophilus]
MTTQEIQGVFKRVARRCNLESKVHLHTMRHTLAITLLNRGAPLAAAQFILGHEKLERSPHCHHGMPSWNRSRTVSRLVPYGSLCCAIPRQRHPCVA